MNSSKFEYVVTVECDENGNLKDYVLNCGVLGIEEQPITASDDPSQIIYQAIQRYALEGSALTPAMKHWIGGNAYDEPLTDPESYAIWLEETQYEDRANRLEAKLRQEYPQLKDKQHVYNAVPYADWDIAGSEEAQWIDENEHKAQESFIANGKDDPLWLEWNQRCIEMCGMTEDRYKLWKSMGLYKGRKPKKFIPVISLF